MSDPVSHEAPRPDPPGASRRSRASWRSRVGGVAVVGVVAASALLALYLERKAPLDLEKALGKVEAALEKKRRTKWLATLRAACVRHDCACAKKAAAIGLDAEASDPVLGLAADAATCVPAEMRGVRAEALVRKGEHREGLAEASRATADDPHALYARALDAYRARQLDVAMRLAESSQQSGRGWSATLLVGLIAYEAGNFDYARGAFRSLLQDDPNDVDALWNIGVTAQKQGRYGEARTTYLKVARLRPQNADVRHNLAVLAHSVGALDEARHHFEKFRALGAPKARIDQLEATLAQKPSNPPAQVLSLGKPVASGSAVSPASAGPAASGHP